MEAEAPPHPVPRPSLSHSPPLPAIQQSSNSKFPRPHLPRNLVGSFGGSLVDSLRPALPPFDVSASWRIASAISSINGHDGAWPSIILISTLNIECSMFNPNPAIPQFPPLPRPKCRAMGLTYLVIFLSLGAMPWETNAAPKQEPSQSTDSMTNSEERAVKITVAYDNYECNPSLQTAWGFACLIQAGHSTVLFDTGGDGPTLLGNLEALGVDPKTIDAVVLSHPHHDHVGGLRSLLETGVRPPVYVPTEFPAEFKREIGLITMLEEVERPLEIAPGIHATGRVGTGIVEQALVVATPEGNVVITGCAHPGVSNMVYAARRIIEGEVTLVMGGFHLRSASDAQLRAIIHDLEAMGVQRVAPCHCTGDHARSFFAQAYGTNYIAAGAGWSITLH